MQKKFSFRLLTNIFLFVLIFSLAVQANTPCFAASNNQINTLQINGNSYSRSAINGAALAQDFSLGADYIFKPSELTVTGYESYKLQLSIAGAIIEKTPYNPASGDSFEFSTYIFASNNRSYPIVITLLGTNGAVESQLDDISFSIVFGDIQSPRVVEKIPASGGTGINVASSIVVRFDEPLQASTINSSNIYISGKSSSISYNNDNYTITLNPSGNFSGLTEYTVTIKSNGIKDLAGNAADGSSWQFRTASDPAAVPEIENKQPAANATNVAVNTNVVISFSKPLDVSTVNSSSVTIKKSGLVVPVTIIPISESSSGKGIITIDPNSVLDNAAVYTVSFTGLKDTDGIAVASSSWSFTTEPGAVPVVEERYPDSNGTSVAVGIHPTVKFSKAMTSSTIISTNTSSANIYLTRSSSSGTRVAADVTYSSSTRTATIIPDSDLSYSTVYYLNIDNDIKDIDGNAIAAVNWKFTTGSSDTAQISSRSPAANATNVALDTAISFKFSRAMYSSSINESNIYLRRSGSTSNISLDLDYDSGTRIVTLTPDKDLSFDSTYIVYVSDNVKDTNRDPITPVTWSFSTAQESDLRITDRNPDSGDTGISLSSKITIKFSNTLKSSSVTASTCYLRVTSSGTSVPAAVTYSSSSRTVTITPSDPLKSNTQYTVYVTSGVKDSDGMAFSGTSWKFRTKTETISVTDFRPLANAAGVSIRPTITCTFSGAMDSATLRNANFYLRKYSTGESIPASVSYNSATRSATLTPASPLDYAVKYTVFLTSDVESGSGAAVSALNWSFTTVEKPMIGTSIQPLVKVNGRYIDFSDANPYIKEGRTMIPFRALFEAMNATVDYNSSTKRVMAKLGSNTVVLFVGKLVAYRNSQAITLDVPPISIDSRVMIPLRFAGEALGGKVKWDPTTYTVIITTP